MSSARTKLLCTTLLVSGLVAGFAPLAPMLATAPAYAQQQRVEVREEFRVALEPHGRFERHPRLGEVWRPARVAKDWRPYTVGRWVYTDDLGWYWNSAQSEADWGWVAFHYGRWVDDREMGWVWIPGNEWGPAWVNWRRGEGPAVAARGSRSNDTDARYIGWAPLAPDDYETDYADNPDVWIFVRARDLVSPRVNTVIIRERRPEFLQRTVIVNRTVVVRDRGVNVNPGIPPAYVAAFVGRPIVSYDVRPRVIAGTTRVNNAIEFRTQDLRDSRRMQRDRPVIRETRTRIEAAREIPAPRALETNERGGRLGERPPRAAQAPADRKQGEPTTGNTRTGDQRQDRTTGERSPDQRGADQRGSTSSPGRVGDTPGQSRTAPGRASDTPGQVGTAPGRAGDKPGQAEKAPSRAGDTPGQVGTAPGRAGDKPGQAEKTPNRVSDGPARQQERGAQPREDRAQPAQRPERAQGAPDRAPAARAQEPAAPPRGGRDGATGSTPTRGGEGERRGGDAERGAKEPRPQAKPDAPRRPAQPE